jgi:ABC-type phosphate/phosphonate transport system substrate-binding protein
VTTVCREIRLLPSASAYPYHRAVGITFVLPPSLGPAKATARAELLESALARALDEPVKVVVAGSYAELEDLALSGKAEVVWAPAAVCAMLPSARAIFTIVRGGRSSYRSALVARRDATLTIDSLAGTRAAWVDPLSAGGYVLVVAMLRERGMDPDKLFASQAFLGSHRAAVEAVLHDEADVTAVSIADADAEALEERLRWYAGPAGARLTTVAITDLCPSDAIVITTATSETRAKELAEKLVPKTAHARARSRLLSALEAEGLVAADIADYRMLRSALRQATLGPRPSAPPSGRRPSTRPPRSR